MLKSYMYTHRRGILAFFLMMLAAACIIRLYELPPEAVGYTAAVSGFIGAVFLLEDFMRFRKHACVLGTLHREALVSPDSCQSRKMIWRRSIRSCFGWNLQKRSG